MGTKTARESIAFGPTESFTYPVPAGFVRQRETIGAGVTVVSDDVRIDKQLNIGLAISVILVDDAAGTNYDLYYRELVSSDGIDGATGGYKNALWAPYVTVVLGETAPIKMHSISSLTFPATQAIQVKLKNNGALATAAPVSVANPLGKGLHVRVADRSQP